MRLRADTKELVMLHTVSRLDIFGYAVFNSQLESLRALLENRSWIELEMPFILGKESKPLLLPFPYITIQRSNIVYYTLEIPEPIKAQAEQLALQYGILQGRNPIFIQADKDKFTQIQEPKSVQSKILNLEEFRKKKQK